MARRRRVEEAPAEAPNEERLRELVRTDPGGTHSPRPSKRDGAEKVEGARLGGAWEKVVDLTFSFDPVELRDRLYREIELGVDRTEYGTILAALDRADRNAVDAQALARLAKLEDEAFGQEVEERLGVLRAHAVDALEAEKAAGKRSKAPTLDDIRGRMVADYGDEVRALERRRAELHGAARVLESLHDAWRSRAASLREMASRRG